MANCNNCGTQVQDDVKFCPSCGQTVGNGPAAAPFAATGAPAAVQGDPADVEANKLMAILAYIIFFIPLLTGAHKTSPFAKFHTNQGTVLAIVAFVYGFAYGILSVILAFIPIIGWLIIALLGFASIIFPIFIILGIVNVVNGKMAPLPIIGKYTIIK